MYEFLKAYAADTRKAVDLVECRCSRALWQQPLDEDAFKLALAQLVAIAETAIFLGFMRTAELATTLHRTLASSRKVGAPLAADAADVAATCAAIRELTGWIERYGGEQIAISTSDARPMETIDAEASTAPMPAAAPQGAARAVPLDAVVVGDRMRHLDEATVAALAESIAAIGLQNPISIAPGVDGRPVLVAGRHRLEAMRRLGRTEIEVRAVDMNELTRDLWQIDENLIRSELTQLECDQHLQRRRELYEALHLGATETGRKSPSLGGRGRKGFASDTEAKTGVPKRRTNEALRRVRAIAPDVQEAIKDLPVADVAVELDALAGLPVEAQRRAAAAVREGSSASIREAVGAEPSEPGSVERQLERLQRAWRQAGQEARQKFIRWVAVEPQGDTGKPKDSTAA